MGYAPQMLFEQPCIAQVQILEENAAGIHITSKYRRPALRHVTRAHRVNLGWLFELVGCDASSWRRHDKTPDQVAYFLKKGQRAAPQFAHICKLAQVGLLCAASKKNAMAGRYDSYGVSALLAPFNTQDS